MGEPVTTITFYLAAKEALYWGDRLEKIYKALNNDHQKLTQNIQEISSELASVNYSLQRIESKIDDQRIAIANTGVEHLITGVTSNVRKVQLDELRMARSKFGELIGLNPNSTTSGIENKYLIGMGYWGSYHYFNLRQDYRLALIQVYECTAKYPVIGVSIFPEEFFRQNSSYVIGVHEELKRLKLGKNYLANNPVKQSTDHSRECAEESRKSWNPITKVSKFGEAALYAGNAMIQNTFEAEKAKKLTQDHVNPSIANSFLPSEVVLGGELYSGNSQSLNKHIEVLESKLKSLTVQITSECLKAKTDLEKLVI